MAGVGLPKGGAVECSPRDFVGIDSGSEIGAPGVGGTPGGSLRENQEHGQMAPRGETMCQVHLWQPSQGDGARC